MSILKKLLYKNEKGQGVMEYIVISGLVGIFCLAAMKNYGTTLRSRITDMTSKVTQENLNLK
jgi:Flp pilus assembly pilin Flp